MNNSQQPFNNIKGVFFDLDGTLKVSEPSGVDALLGYMRDCGFPIDHDARRAGHRFSHEYWSDRDRVENDMETMGPDSFWQNYIRAQMIAMALIPANDADNEVVVHINRRFAKEFSPVSYIAPGGVELLSILRDHHFILGLVSNRPLPLKDTAQRLGIYDYFHFTLAAGEIGSWKPDAGIFLKAAELAHIRPHEAAYVGDNYFADVLGACHAGLSAIFVDPLQAFPEAEEIAFVVRELGDLLHYLD